LSSLGHTLDVNVLKCLCIFNAGNLALSRALGDFVFKGNNMKQPEEQIVTGLPYFWRNCS